ncbi:heparinase II/III family protein [Paenibacillus arenilitoris]|uniref:Alginate lyase family protein n=1 Tax=Paenibacillus arenilitoris TaxID=2772299 RepID=A0A927CHN5_9BACL|nr:alginate lyase family protein [Paenibacillus arenilitoris]MBD2867222.1 alginate lyase family protein [Paenibacillus arenilitoris]
MNDVLYFVPEQREEWGERFRAMFPKNADEAVAEAKSWCDGNVFHWKDLAIDMGNPIDWLHNPTGDKEFTWGVNRFKHLRSLGIAFACTGDEKYAAKAWEHVSGWIASQSCPWGLPAEELTYFQRPGPWRLLETGLRLRQWVYAYHFFRGTASWSRAAESLFLESVKEHANFLAKYPASIEINHSIMHMIGLLSAGLTFPSWKESEAWIRVAVDRLESCIRAQVLPDGAHAELTPHYHMVSLELFVDCAVMLRKRGLSFSDEYERILAGMARFSRCMTRQDGSMAPFADSYANQPPDLNAAALYYDKRDWLLPDQVHEQYWTVGPDSIERLMAAGEAVETGKLEAGNGTEGDAGPAFAFPSAGYYGIGNGEQRMIFDAAALGGPHGHADALSFEWCAFGQPLLVDPGTYTYMETPWRRYFKSTAAHNTVLVDGQDQSPYLRTQRWGTPEAAVKLIAWDPAKPFLCAEHDGYAIRGVIHRRAVWLLESGEWVVIDKLTGTGAHTFQHRLHSRMLHWHMTKQGQTGDAGAVRYSLTGSGPACGDPAIRCDMLLFGPPSMEVDVEDGWESVRPMSMEPLKVVQALLTLDNGGWFATVMKPRLAAGGESDDGSPASGLDRNWFAAADEDGRPAVTLRRDGDQTTFRMPD